MTPLPRRFDRLPLQSRLRWAAAACLASAWLATTALLSLVGPLSLAQTMPLSLTLAAVLVVVWFVLRRFERRALAPLAEIASALRALIAPHERGSAAASVDLAAVRMPVPPTDDEVAVLARGINELALRLHEAWRHEREQSERIEEQVRHRTQALRASVDEAEAASQAKSRFLANLGHEVRTPMNSVLGIAQLMSATSLDASQRNYLDLMQRSAGALLGLLDEILDFSRIESRSVELVARPVALRALLDEVAASVYPLASERQLLFDVQLSPELPQRVQADDQRLRQVCLNLLTNAIKFTPIGQVVLRASAQGTDIVIEVADTGPGVAAEMRTRIFTPFVQLDDSMARRQGGVGLGLSIVGALVRAMGGRIDLDSEPGHGSTFRVHLPLARLDADAEAVGATEPPLRVAIVSDPSDSQQMLRDRLSFIGHLCVGALTWRELAFAPEALSAAQPDCVIYDEPPSGWPVDGRALRDALQAPWRSLLIDRRAPASAQPALPRIARPLSDAALKRALKSTAPLSAVEVEAAPAAGIVGGERGTHLAQGQVLLIEDNPTNQIVARSFLEHLGFEVAVAADASRAFDLLRENDYALILMDCQLPGMDGYEATRRIRAGEVGARAQRMPIVALTAHASPDDRQRCLDAGMNDYLTKPIEVGRLSGTLQRWLAAPRA